MGRCLWERRRGAAKKCGKFTALPGQLHSCGLDAAGLIRPSFSGPLLLLEKQFFHSLLPQPPIPAHTSTHVPLLPQETDFEIKYSSNWVDTQLDSVVQHIAQTLVPDKSGWKKWLGAEREGEGWNSPFQQQPDLCQIKVTMQPRPLWVAPLISFWACEESAFTPAELRAAQTGFIIQSSRVCWTCDVLCQNFWEDLWQL